MKKIKVLKAISFALIGGGCVACAPLALLTGCKKSDGGGDNTTTGFSATINGTWKKYIATNSLNYIHVTGKDEFVVNNKICSVTPVDGLTWATSVDNNGNITVNGSPNVNGVIELTITIENKTTNAALTINDNTAPGFRVEIHSSNGFWQSIAIQNSYIQLIPYNGFECYGKTCTVESNITGLTFGSSTDQAGKITVSGTPTNHGLRSLTVYINGISAEQTIEIKYVGNSSGTNWDGYISGSISTQEWSGHTGMVSVSSSSSSGSYVAEDLQIPQYVNFNNQLLQIGRVEYLHDLRGSVALPNSVIELNSTFYNCSSLSSITLPNSITSIGSGTFWGCSSLSSITLPNSITSIDLDNTFYNCSSLSSITLPNSITSIGNQAFYNCSSLSSITLPNSITSIGNQAFYNCTNLFSNTFGDNYKISKDGNNVFYFKNNNVYYCLGHYTNVTDASVPLPIGSPLVLQAGTTIIADGAFYGGINVSGSLDIRIPDGVTRIGSNAFTNCYSSAATITLPNSITSIGSFAFYNCNGLISESEENNKIWIYNSDMLVLKCDDRYYYLGSPKMGVDQWTVRGVWTILAGTKVIAEGAFRGDWMMTGLEFAKATSSTMYFGENAFYGCFNLESISASLSEDPNWYGTNIFSGVKETGKVRISGSDIGDYSSAKFLDFLKTKGLPQTGWTTY